MKGKIIYKDQEIAFDKLAEFIAKINISELEDWEQDLFSFIRAFIEGQDFYEIRTSGSTGEPKKIKVHRDDLILSAGITNDFLGLDSQSTAIHCLPSRFIAGKMMFVRAFVGDYNLIVTKPVSNSLESLDHKVDFIALTPFQVEQILKSKESTQKLRGIREVIIGGASVNDSIISRISEWTNNVYNTYGMTETLSHVAMAKLNSEHPKHFLSVSDKFQLETDERQCLLVSTPYRHAKKLVTNDVVQFNEDFSFKWIGRVDNIINTGSIKINPETIEAKLQGLIIDPFIVSSEEDRELGNKMILVIESRDDYYETDGFKNSLSSVLEKYEIPRKIVRIEKFNRLANDKIDRLHLPS